MQAQQRSAPALPSPAGGWVRGVCDGLRFTYDEG